MAAKKRPHKRRHVLRNPVAAAIARCQTLAPAERADLVRMARDGLDQLRRGPRADDHVTGWRTLADTISLAAEYSCMGIASDDESRAVIAAAQQAIEAVAVRHHQRGTWALYAGEVQALEDLIERYEIQMDFVSVGEMERAIDKVRSRTVAALRGHGQPGIKVVEVAA